MDGLVIDSDGNQRWYNSDNQLHRDNDLPAVIYSSGTQYWYKNNQQHRDNDLPAKIYPSGTQYWCKNNKYHRDNDLPAVIQAEVDENTGEKKYFVEYYVDGIFLSEKELDEESYNICKYDPNRPIFTMPQFVDLEIETI